MPTAPIPPLNPVPPVSPPVPAGTPGKPVRAPAPTSGADASTPAGKLAAASAKLTAAVSSPASAKPAQPAAPAKPTPSAAAPTSSASGPASPRDAQLITLLGLRDSQHQIGPFPQRPEDRLVQARLGIANSLFAALRAKHSPTAAHCLRVALGVSSWSLLMEMSNEERDAIEIAALLHDIGKIGVPDSVLLKPSTLHGDELLVMERHRLIGQQILAGCCNSPDMLEIAHFIGAWYDGSRPGFDRQGDALPRGARMVSIVDAFDSMTTDHVYRRAMPRERAMAELYGGAGTQFDADLVREFCSLTAADQVRLDASVARRWLKDIGAEESNQNWRLGPVLPLLGGAASGEPDAFHDRLLESMFDAVVFVDLNLRVIQWNRATERLTGVSAGSVKDRRWTPQLVELHDEHDEEVSEEACPVARCLSTGVQSLERMSIRGRRSARLGINLQVAPVLSHDGRPRGAIVVIHDASSQITLEERVQMLHTKATQDPLTRVANRAEFDRVLQEFVATHQDEGLPCSLIICDIDHFKRVNDTFGHPAGDDALVTFAGVLQSYTRAGDLVARYGGEEFVLLCADCDQCDAARRAEEVRSRVASIPVPSLKNWCLTASFGVTGVQAGDTPETMLARADRALMQAKDSGRNRVVQLGTGVQETKEAPSRTGWLRGLFDGGSETNINRQLQTAVPLAVAVEKLRGFVADHHAEIVEVREEVVSLRLSGTSLLRRQADRPVAFFIGVRFQELSRPAEGYAQTLIDVTIRPQRRRDRRVQDFDTRAQLVLASLKAYFMAQEIPRGAEQPEPTPSSKPRGFFGDLLRRK